jgi:hypothetical protein
MKYNRFLLRIGLLAVVLFVGVGVAHAKDQWVRVQSKNFVLIGNASEKEIRRVGTKLEQFRETFRNLLRR